MLVLKAPTCFVPLVAIVAIRRSTRTKGSSEQTLYCNFVNFQRYSENRHGSVALAGLVASDFHTEKYGWGL